MRYQSQIILLFFAASMIACSDKNAQESKLGSAEIIAVKLHTLQQSNDAVVIHCTGLLNTENEATYAFKIGGVIDRIYVVEGETFKKGELLAKLQLEEIEAGFAQAKLGFEKAERDLNRLSNLYKDSVATLEQLQDTKTAFEISQRQLEATAFNKQYANIYAANDGFVIKKIGNEGEVVAGGSPILAISENGRDSWLLNVGLSDKEWSMVEIGNTAQVVLDAFPDKVLTGRVFRKSMAADLGTGSFQVEVKVNFQGLNPAVGMFGKASLVTNYKYEYQAIPYDALIEADGKNAFVFVPVGEGKVKRQAIEIAGFDNSEVRIKSGLEGLKEVVLTNSAFLNENSTITIIQ